MESKAAGDEHNILTFCVYEVCILKTVVFPVQFSQLLQVLLLQVVSLSFLLVCTFVKSNNVSAHMEVQSSLRGSELE